MSEERAEVALRRKIVGRFLRDRRVKLGLTQADVSKHMGYTTAQFISNWERGVALPPHESMPRLATLYKVPGKDFVKVVHQYQVQLTALRKKALERLFTRKGGRSR